MHIVSVYIYSVFSLALFVLVTYIAKVTCVIYLTALIRFYTVFMKLFIIYYCFFSIWDYHLFCFFANVKPISVKGINLQYFQLKLDVIRGEKDFTTMCHASE